MIIIVCVEDRWGMAFNGRRLSMDKAVKEKILELSSGSCLWMEEYSRKQFEGTKGLEKADIRAGSSYMEEAGKGEFCFLERENLKGRRESIESVILFRWNRAYPADVFFDRELLRGLSLTKAEEFSGSSHEKITLEVYGK